jgi:hypothetical protein
MIGATSPDGDVTAEGSRAEGSTTESEATATDSATGRTLGAWIAWLVAVVAAMLGVVYGIAERSVGVSLIEQTPLSYVAGAVVAIVYASVGLALRLRRAQRIIGWLFLAFGLVAGLANLSWAYVIFDAERGFPPGLIDAHDLAWLANSLIAPAWFAVAIALISLFPDGKPISPRWRLLLVGSLVGAALLAACLAVVPGRLLFWFFAENRHAAQGWLATAAEAATPLVLLGMVGLAAAATWSMRLRYARAGPIEQLQLRWFAWASGLVIVGATIEVFLVGVLEVSTAAADVAWLAFTAAAISVPIAALVAILRYRLYDIDRLIGQTFVLGALTAILAGLYTASLRLFTAIFVGVTGQTSDVALVLTTLVLATSFTPVKQRLEAVANERWRPQQTAATAAEAVPPELDERIETIARRVSLEVLEQARSNGLLGEAAHVAPSEKARSTDSGPR